MSFYLGIFRNVSWSGCHHFNKQKCFGVRGRKSNKGIVSISHKMNAKGAKKQKRLINVASNQNSTKGSTIKYQCLTKDLLILQDFVKKTKQNTVINGFTKK